MTRRKQTALIAVPQSQAEAVALVQAYVAADRRALELKLGYELQIDKLKAERDTILAGLAAEQQGRFARLKAWWEAGGKDLAGKKRSAELAGAAIGVRLTPPAVKFGKAWNAQKVLLWLQGLRWSGRSRFIRTKTELDKQAIIKAIGEESVAKAFEHVLSVEQSDEFFIDTQLDPESIGAAIRDRLGASAASDASSTRE